MIIIPARLESSRLPNKLLLPLGGIPIIVRVANIAKELDSCIVACDSSEIESVCKRNNIECIMTSKSHQSGTDRCAEVAQKLHLSDDEIIINLQGDEPFIEHNVIESLMYSMKTASNSVFMASCYKNISDSNATNPNLVKVVVDSNNFALYFSRSKIPYNRDTSANLQDVGIGYFGHLGIYAFRTKTLLEFCTLPKSPLEHIEKLEQLRALWNGKKILMVKVKSEFIGIDTIEDYNNALKLIKENDENNHNKAAR